MPVKPNNPIITTNSLSNTLSDKSLDSYLTIQPKQTPEGVLVGVQNDDLETRERFDRGGERMVGAEGGI